MSSTPIQRKRRRENRMQFKSLGNHEEFLERITKTLYYSELPSTERFSLPLSELAVELYSEVKYGKTLDRLTLEDASEISRNACISPCSLVLAMLYLEQLKTSNPVYIDKVTPSELFVISLMVASKFLNDSGEEDDVLNSEWATSANLSVSDLNKLEKDFLNAIDWKVFIKDSEFWKKLRSVETRVALNEGKKRGWFSYTDMETLLDQVNAFLLAQALFTVSAVCLASYTAGMLTVIGSTMVATHLTYMPRHSSPWTQITTDLINMNQTSWNDIHPTLPNDFVQNVQHPNGSDEACYYVEYSCPENNDMIRTSISASVENISTFYKNILVPMSHNLISFSEHWKEPRIFIFSH